MTTIKKTITKEVTPRILLTLPDEVGHHLRLLGLKERKAYCTELLKAGWTLQSVADQLNITREAVRLYQKATTNDESEVRKAIADLPVPPLPTKIVTKEVTERLKVTDDVLLELKGLHDQAKLVRGKSKNNRTEAENFTRLAWEAVQSGVSVYSLAKSLGLTVGALTSRFVRYGYKTTQGTSPAYRTMQYRLQDKENDNA